MVVIGKMHPHITKLFCELARELYKLAHALFAAAVLPRHTADSERVAVDHFMLSDNGFGIAEHAVERSVRDADIHTVLINKICDLLRLDRSDSGNLNRVDADRIKISKSLFGILIILYVVA